MPGLLRDVELDGELAYAVGDGSDLRIVDVSNPAEPREVGMIRTGYEPYDVELVGDLAYVANRFRGVQIIDVADPRAPIEIGAIELRARSRSRSPPPWRTWAGPRACSSST